MNARLPLLRAIPSGADALPPYQPGTQRFAVTVEGVALDTLIHYGDDFDLSVAAIWHRGVDIAPLLQDGIEETILNAYDVQEKELREKAAQLQQPATTPGAPAVDPDKLAGDMQACTDLDKLYELGGLLEAITDEAQRLRVNEIFDARVAQLEQP